MINGPATVSTTADADELAVLRARVERLEERAARERKARLEAEEIAENGMRELFRSNQDLDKRIMERTMQLDLALAEATAAGKARSQFLAHMSHHLLTPLNGVVGMLDLLGDAAFEPHQIEWHDSAQRSAHRLDRLIRQMTTYAAIGGVDLRQTAPREQLSDVLKTLAADWRQPMLLAGQLPIFETVGFGDETIAAPPELYMMFAELFDNVVKHAGPGAVTISVRTVDAATVAVDISDAGRGAHQAQHAASPLQIEEQGDGPAGFGLTLVRAIAEALGGRLVLAETGQSVSTVELPVTRGARPGLVERQDAETESKR